MSDLKDAVRELAIANRILAREEVCDYLGHISIRHPTKKDRFLLSCSRAPELVKVSDIMEYDLEGNSTDGKNLPMYVERFIHAAIYAARPDVNSVSHNHAYDLLPFAVSPKAKLKALVHPAFAIGLNPPTWDFRKKFKGKSPLVLNMVQGNDLAKTLGKKNNVALMRNHGVVVAHDTLLMSVYTSIYLKVNAKVQTEAMKLGPVSYLKPDELKTIEGLYTSARHTVTRGWEYWVRRADVTGVDE
jgi:ribulose-5-phosphate 4-epimerase/fuculose-1-phosphate aldolase